MPPRRLTARPYERFRWERLDPIQRTLAIVAHHWFQAFADRYGFPDNYSTVDVETNGVDPERSLICTAGVTIVRNRRIVTTEEHVLDWTRHPDIDQRWLQETLYQTQQAMERLGKNFYHTYEFLRANGRPPAEVLQRYLTLFEEGEATGELFVAHNGWRFDVELFQAAFHNYLGVPYRFHGDMVYDSGVAEKASQLEARDNPLPEPHEDLRDWAWRVGELRRRGILWALDRYCEPRYGLTQKAGLGHNDFHKSGSDSILLHYLMEEHRQLAGAAAQAIDAGLIDENGAPRD